MSDQITERVVAAVAYAPAGMLDRLPEGVWPTTNADLSAVIWRMADEKGWRLVSRGLAFQRGPLPIYDRDGELVHECFQTCAHVVFADA